MIFNEFIISTNRLIRMESFWIENAGTKILELYFSLLVLCFQLPLQPEMERKITLSKECLPQWLVRSMKCKEKEELPVVNISMKFSLSKYIYIYILP